MNIPSMSKAVYKKYEKEVGLSIEQAAKESCKKAAEEERQLVIENVEELRSEL